MLSRVKIRIHTYICFVDYLRAIVTLLRGNEFSRWGHELRHAIVHCSECSSLSIASCRHYFALFILYLYIDHPHSNGRPNSCRTLHFY